MEAVLHLYFRECCRGCPIPLEGIRTTLGHITRTVGTSGVRSLDAGGRDERKSDDRPYDVAPGFAAAWKKARGLS